MKKTVTVEFIKSCPTFNIMIGDKIRLKCSDPKNVDIALADWLGSGSFKEHRDFEIVR